MAIGFLHHFSWFLQVLSCLFILAGIIWRLKVFDEALKLFQYCCFILCLVVILILEWWKCVCLIIEHAMMCVLKWFWCMEMCKCWVFIDAKCSECEIWFKNGVCLSGNIDKSFVEHYLIDYLINLTIAYCYLIHIFDYLQEKSISTSKSIIKWFHQFDYFKWNSELTLFWFFVVYNMLRWVFEAIKFSDRR